jgi:hypothetical protein
MPLIHRFEIEQLLKAPKCAAIMLLKENPGWSPLLPLSHATH